jgi:hypothetical protein
MTGQTALHPHLVQGIPPKVTGAFVAAFMLFAGFAAAETMVVPPPPPVTSIVISVAEQKLTILRDGMFWRKYPISTSKFGLGDSYGSYKTPVGHLRVCEKIGEELTPGSVIKERHATGEVLPANAPGRDPIVTRVIWLDGLEDQNHNARSRGIYIHGTTEEAKIGKPASYGCIRMRSQDVLDVFEQVGIDTAVEIIPDKFPKYAKYVPAKPQIIVVAPKPAPPKPAPAAPPPAIASAPTNPAPSLVLEKINPATGRKSAVPASAPIAIYRPPPVESTITHTSVTTTAVSNSVVARAMEGSMLSAGLPDGPKIPTLPEPPSPKDIPRFGRLAPAPVSEKGLSLQPADANLTPAIQAAEADAQERAGQPQSGGQSDSDIALRANSQTSNGRQ